MKVSFCRLKTNITHIRSQRRQHPIQIIFSPHPCGDLMDGKCRSQIPETRFLAASTMAFNPGCSSEPLEIRMEPSRGNPVSINV
jgi:hypothetical protein